MARPGNPNWKKGGPSPNPGGRPKADQQIIDLARQHSPECIMALVKIATSGKLESARVAAASHLLDRAWGRPRQAIEHSGLEAGQLAIRVEMVQPGDGDELE